MDAAFKKEWDDWNNLPEDDPNSWDAPDFAFRIDGGYVTFSDPQISGKPIS